MSSLASQLARRSTAASNSGDWFDELAQALGQPAQADLVVRAALRELLDALVGEVHLPVLAQWASAASITPRCSAECLAADPPAGAELGGSEMGRTCRGPAMPGIASAMVGHAPMLAGSSCTQAMSVAAGYLASCAASSSAGTG